MTENERNTLKLAYKQLKRAHDTLMSMPIDFDRELYSRQLVPVVVFFQTSLKLTGKELEEPVPPTRLNTLSKLRDCQTAASNAIKYEEVYHCLEHMAKIFEDYVGDDAMSKIKSNMPEFEVIEEYEVKEDVELPEAEEIDNGTVAERVHDEDTGSTIVGTD